MRLLSQVSKNSNRMQSQNFKKWRHRKGFYRWYQEQQETIYIEKQRERDHASYWFISKLKGGAISKQKKRPGSPKFSVSCFVFLRGKTKCKDFKQQQQSRRKSPWKCTGRHQHTQRTGKFHAAWAWCILSQNTAEEYDRIYVRTTWSYLRRVMGCK